MVEACWEIGRLLAIDVGSCALKHGQTPEDFKWWQEAGLRKKERLVDALQKKFPDAIIRS